MSNKAVQRAVEAGAPRASERRSMSQEEIDDRRLDQRYEWLVDGKKIRRGRRLVKTVPEAR